MATASSFFRQCQLLEPGTVASLRYSCDALITRISGYPVVIEPRSKPEPRDKSVDLSVGINREAIIISRVNRLSAAMVKLRKRV